MLWLAQFEIEESKVYLLSSRLGYSVRIVGYVSELDDKIGRATPGVSRSIFKSKDIQEAFTVFNQEVQHLFKSYTRKMINELQPPF